MSNETRGGARPGAGRPRTGRERENFTTTVSPDTKTRMKKIGVPHRKRGAWIDTAVENAYLLCLQGEDFEVSVRNLIFCFEDKDRKAVFYGETVRELLQMRKTHGSPDEDRRLRANELAYAYKYGQWPGGDETSRAFLWQDEA
jgi:hypothetical protein